MCSIHCLGYTFIYMSKNISNKAFLTYYDNEEMYTLLSDEDAGRLIKAMFRYCKDDEEVLSREDGMIYGFFAVLKAQFSRDNDKYVKQALRKKEKDRERYEKKKMEKGTKEESEILPQKQMRFTPTDIDNSDEPF